MTWTYSATSSGLTARNYIRLRVGDTSSGNQRIQDEEIDAILAVYGDTLLSAAVVAETVAGSYAGRGIQKKVGGLSISLNQASEHYSQLARNLRAEASMRAMPYAGGISEATVQAEEQDPDRVRPAFTVGQFDDPGEEST